MEFERNSDAQIRCEFEADGQANVVKGQVAQLAERPPEKR